MHADYESIEKVKKGDIKEYSTLVLKHQKSLLRVVYRLVGDLAQAEDIVQETFLKAFQKIQLFEGRSSFKSWLFQIGINTAKNKLRGKRHDTSNIDDLDVPFEAQIEEGIMRSDLKETIRKEVNQLPHRQRTALELRIYDDLSFAEIATLMQCPYDTAKANYRHALMKLRLSLIGDDFDTNTTEIETKNYKKTKNEIEVDA